MVNSTDALASQLLTLSPVDRARLAEVLLASLDQDEERAPAAEVEAAWTIEAARRLAELNSGTVAGVPAEQVLAAVRNTIRT